MIIQMTNKGKQKPLNFYLTIQTIAAKYEFEVATDQVKHQLIADIEFTMRRWWPKVSPVGRLSVDMIIENNSLNLNISPLLIKEMEDVYPESMI